jgi:hypothetical protein
MQISFANIVQVVKCHKGIINVGVARVQRSKNVENAYLVDSIDDSLRRTEVKGVMTRYHPRQGQLSCMHSLTGVASASATELAEG